MNKIHYYKINYVMELLRSEGKEGLDRILEKGNPGAQACEMWLPKQEKLNNQIGKRKIIIPVEEAIDDFTIPCCGKDVLNVLGKKETAINAIVEFYRTNDISIALEFEELISRTKLSSEDLNKVLRQLNDEGYLQDVLWGDGVASTFYLSNFGKRKLGIGD